MRYRGLIKNLKHVIVSDPSYDKNVECRYENDQLDGDDWISELDITDDGEFIDFEILLKKNDNDCVFVEHGFRYKADGLIKHQIGMDTACISIGTNQQANEIIKVRDIWQPSVALRTGYDGLFGNVMEGVTDGKTTFLSNAGSFDKEIGYDIQSVVNYLEKQLNISDLVLNNEECDIEK